MFPHQQWHKAAQEAHDICMSGGARVGCAAGRCKKNFEWSWMKSAIQKFPMDLVVADAWITFYKGWREAIIFNHAKTWHSSYLLFRSRYWVFMASDNYFDINGSLKITTNKLDGIGLPAGRKNQCSRNKLARSLFSPLHNNSGLEDRVMSVIRLILSPSSPPLRQGHSHRTFATIRSFLYPS